jgi:sugar O-acyltransferase (sialic acid O-acetyltransferase NeuD family)
MGQEVADLARRAGAEGSTGQVIGFVDDDPALRGQEILGLPVLGGSAWLRDHDAVVAVALGSSAARARIVEALASWGVQPAPALVHPEASVGTGTQLGEGTVVAAHATLTTEVSVGRFAIVNVGATVSHRARLGDFTTVAPGVHLAGEVRAGEGVDVGLGASVIQGLTLGSWSVVGAGAVVVSDVPPDTTVLGCPARVVATRSRGWQT